MTRWAGSPRTVNYQGNRIDIGGHRFFSKSDGVMDWWRRILPLQHTEDGAAVDLGYQGAQRLLDGASRARPGASDQVMLVRTRLSRIYYLRKFFNYPIRLDSRPRNLGLWRTPRSG